MNEAAPDNLPAPLKAFRERVAAGPPEPGAMPAMLAELAAGGLLEHALALFRQLGPGRGWEPFRTLLKAEVAASRERRMSLWQIDPQRRTLRLLFAASGAACQQGPPALAGQLARTLLSAGLPLAMGLEKVPRPALHLAHPLPLGVPGREEIADAVLARPPELPAEALPALVNRFAAGGLELLRCLPVPNYATPAADLCRAALWRWCCPGGFLPAWRTKIVEFIGAERFEIVKPGKTGGHKGEKRVDIRPLLEDLAWEGACLTFRTRIEAGQAPNPRKLLGAVLGLDPEAVAGLERLALVLAEDPRLLQAERYEPKLHNMFEDAVLLESGGHIRIIDGDDDDPIVLGG